MNSAMPTKHRSRIQRRRTPIRRGFLGAVFVGSSLPFGGCSSPAPRLGAPSPPYIQALEDTANGGVSALADRPAEEDAAVQRVMDLFSDFSEANIRNRVRGVYADTLFFRDGFKQFTSLDPLASYLMRSTQALRSCTFEFEPVIKNGPDYYFRWTMIVSLKRDPEDRVDRTIGMSHFRFNREGKVVFQQDYWDPTDVLYSRIPGVSWAIRRVKSRL